jgi:hypothetical protein
MFSRYDRLGASSRLRMFQYEPQLRAEGISAERLPFFDDLYLQRLYEGRRTNKITGAAYLGRIGQLRRAGTTDVLWVEKEILPWMPWTVEQVFLPRHVPVVVDYDDAIFHAYDLHASRIVRRLLGRKIDKVMAAANLVMAGNAYLAERAKAAGAVRVEIVPTVVDTDYYNSKADRATGSEQVIGWIGTPSTWTEYLAPIMLPLTTVAAAEGARIMAVGPGRAAASHALLDVLPWSEETEVSRIQEMDIGVMPLTDTPWARGKCGYKLIQYMACGVPVVASPVGVNAEIVEHGVNGFLATTPAEWSDALVTLLRDPELRRRMGAEGRRKVEAHYSLKVWAPRVAKMLADVAERGRLCSI